MPARIILIVDDDLDFREVVREALEEGGYEATAVPGGAEALAYLQTHPPPALILLDWRMADSDASEFMTAFVAGPCPEVPVVLMTAGRLMDVPGHTGRFAGYLRKPFDLARLFDLAAHYAKRPD